MKIGEPEQRITDQRAAGWPVLRLGFRPFYLGGTAFGLLALGLWLAGLHGYPVAGREPTMTGVIWHVHEMLFGFVAAIVVGFLLTAVRAWTSRETPYGIPLALIWLLWAAGRILVWTGPPLVAAVVDCVFLPLVAFVLGRVLLRAGNRHNVFLPVALGLLGILNVLFQTWAWQGRFDLALRTAYAATGLIILFVAVITGRVVPMFTMNAIPGFTVRRWKWIDALAYAVPLIALVLDAVNAPAVAVFVFALAAAAIHAIRMIGWRSWRVGARPILWILHAACLWIPIGFVLLACSALGRAPHSLAIHALTVGAVGGAIIAMVTRTALGHTGRMLVAKRHEVLSYWLMMAAAALRVLGPLAAPGVTGVWIDAAGVCWCLSLFVYLIKYGPFLTAPRVDGKAG